MYQTKAILFVVWPFRAWKRQSDPSDLASVILQEFFEKSPFNFLKHFKRIITNESTRYQTFDFKKTGKKIHYFTLTFSSQKVNDKVEEFKEIKIEPC